MKLVIAKTTELGLTRRAIKRAREMGAPWAFSDTMPLREELGEQEDGSLYPNYYVLHHAVPRHDPYLLRLFEELGQGMSDDGVEICCLEVPDDVVYYIDSYIGEWVVEKHREWHALDPDGVLETRTLFSKNSVFKKS